MRLGDIERLPSGVAGFVVEFTLEQNIPRIDGVVVRLPYADDARLRELARISGFIYITGGLDPCAYFVHRLFEIPQIVRVSEELRADVEARGEDVFLESLRRLRKPAVIAAAEQTLAGPGETLEVGNTFAYPLSYTWEMILDGKWGELGTRAWAKQGLQPDAVHEILVPGTHEYLSGLRLFVQDMARKFSPRRVPFWIASGEIITASRERRMRIEKPHIVAPSNVVPLIA